MRDPERLEELLSEYPEWQQPSVRAAYWCGFQIGELEAALTIPDVIVRKMVDRGSPRERILEMLVAVVESIDTATLVLDNPDYLTRRLMGGKEEGVEPLPDGLRIPELERYIDAGVGRTAGTWTWILDDLDHLGSSDAAIRKIADERQTDEEAVRAFAGAPETVRREIRSLLVGGIDTD